MTAALSRRAGPLLAVACGGVLVRVVLTGAHRSYVRASTGWLLVLAGVVLVLAGVSALLPHRGDHTDHHAHADHLTDGHADHADDHAEPGAGHGLPRAALLLLLPLALLVLVSPPSLGLYYAQHAGGSAVVLSRPGDEDPLPETAQPLRMSLREALRRSGSGSTLTGHTLLLTGFSAGADDSGRLLLTRLAVRCCAADAQPMQVPVQLASTAVPEPGSWVEVVATVAEDGVFSADSVTPVDEPEDSYEV